MKIEILRVLLSIIVSSILGTAIAFLPSSFIDNSRVIVHKYKAADTSPSHVFYTSHEKIIRTRSERTTIASLPPMLVDAAYIGVGAVTGAVCRYSIGNVVNRKIAETHPKWSYYQGWHTAGINIVGSFVLGTLAGIPTVDIAAAQDHHHGITARTRLMAGVGFCGSFTTFSTFSVDVVAMLTKGDIARALSYMAVNNIGGVAAAACGFSIARKIFGK